MLPGEMPVGGLLDTETAVEFSYCLLEIQLHDPAVKVHSAPIINHHKQINFWKCIAYCLFSHSCKSWLYKHVQCFDKVVPPLHISSLIAFLPYCMFLIIKHILEWYKHNLIKHFKWESIY